MLLLVFVLLAAILLFLLYHYTPKKSWFWAFCVLLAAAAALTWTLYPREAPKPVITAEERADNAEQQKIFSDWYAGYQKDLTALDHNWQQYHRILEDFRRDIISIQTAYVRLGALEQNEGALRARIAGNNPPVALHDNIYDLAVQMTKKTNAYAEAQYRTIALTKAAADPNRLKSDDQEEQSRTLEAVMNRESPSALFIADEIASIRDILTLPADAENGMQKADAEPAPAAK